MLQMLERMVKGSTVKTGAPEVVSADKLQSMPVVMCTLGEDYLLVSTRNTFGEVIVRKCKLQC